MVGRERAKEQPVQMRTGDFQGDLGRRTVLDRAETAEDVAYPAFAVAHAVLGGDQHLEIAGMPPGARAVPVVGILLPARFGQVADDVGDLQQNCHRGAQQTVWVSVSRRRAAAVSTFAVGTLTRRFRLRLGLGIGVSELSETKYPRWRSITPSVMEAAYDWLSVGTQMTKRNRGTVK